MSKKVFLDPGHGGSDSGAVGVNNILEKNINLEVAKKVRDLLKQQGLEVKLSRENDNTVSLSQRTNAANTWKADCYVSIHCNAHNGSAKGIETFSYNSSTKDLANHVHSNILSTKSYTVNRGLKFAKFYVLTHTNMRACLVELGFIDNLEDVKLLTNNQEKFALGITKAICQYLNIEYKPHEENKEAVNPPVSNTDTFYRVVCGSFNNRLNAEERVEQLKEKGFDDAFITVYTKE